ncbi:g-patch domain-containing protein [Ditylenchus destructor]|nr:g-patch domain-containing protein [Ditylenchus destructor]
MQQNDKDAKSATPGGTKVSFRMSVAQQKKDVHIKQSALTKVDVVELEEDDEINTQKRSIAYLENGVARDNDDFPVLKKNKKEYSIPMAKTGNDWRIERLKKLIEEGKATEEDKARLALMMDAFGDGAEKKPTVNNGSVRLPGEADVDEGIDADYEKIPISEFGLAFLRGCGWKEEDGIGRSNRQAVKLKVSVPRPKGLGLGANITPIKSTKELKDANAKVLEKKAHVKIISGTDRGLSGVVQSMDEDNSSCFVELFNSGRVVRVSRFILEVIEKKK